MKIKHLLLPLLAAITLTACSDEPKDTPKYTTLETPVTVTNVPSINEIFSLSCSACRAMEDAIPAIEQAVGEKVGKSHVTFNESSTFAALIYYSAISQTNGNPPEALVKDLFKYVQEQQTESVEENKTILSALFAKYGLTSPYDLDEAQQEKMFAEIERADQITVESGITSVPAFLVNGKYLVHTNAHESAADLASTLKTLLNKDK
ncbi:thiol:disulfide interchange protein DsbA/DsbL [Enterovibrio nigricans]|uniref:Thioredoxin n=1 Tax=Enterovibrio nigricans DSM 22720 TaxID=1121868 RepID=A0A1T4WBR1_9GAMM|nr:thiol:disulfide interchange protein DsbA/DsbL [Enterovibrio nigricans]SKA74488.1 Thioredoxin [Enterovibrio nigricans DSM 22720]